MCKARLRIFRDSKNQGGISLDDISKNRCESSILTVKAQNLDQLSVRELIPRMQEVCNILGMKDVTVI